MLSKKFVDDIIFGGQDALCKDFANQMNHKFEIFVHDIIFGGHDSLCKDFSNQMKHEFEMSMFGEIKFFVGLEVYQLKYDIFFTHSKYIKEILKTFELED